MSLEVPTHHQRPVEGAHGFIQSITNDLRDTLACHEHLVPEVSDRYLNIQQRLITKEQEGVTTFFGGPLDLVARRIRDSWLTPVEVKDDQGFSNFHVISVGCRSGRDLTDAEITIDLTPEISLKIGQDTDPKVEKFNQTLFGGGDEKKRVIIRPSIVGSLAFPLVTTPLDVPSKEVFRERLEKLLKSLGFDPRLVESLDLSLIDEQRFDLAAEFENFYLAEEKEIETPVGKAWVYGVMAMEDPWRYYQIFAFDKLDAVRQQPKTMLRIDSGCDIGMLYGDLGCDCHSQLLEALAATKEEKGIIVHLPTQDGRGYGMNTKMETEAHKRGIEAVFNVGEPAMTTLMAAKRLFGESTYDIRTYDGVGKMLAELGIRDVEVITDSKLKCNQLASVPELNIHRKETGTLEQLENQRAEKHVAEKHASADYF